MSDNFDSFQFKPHFNDHGELKGFTSKDVLGQKHYFDNDGSYKGHKIKNVITHGSDYFDSTNKFMGGTHPNAFDSDHFIKPDGSFGSPPKMFELKDPNFHDNVHQHFKSIRADLIGKIK